MNFYGFFQPISKTWPGPGPWIQILKQLEREKQDPGKHGLNMGLENM